MHIMVRDTDGHLTTVPIGRLVLSNTSISSDRSLRRYYAQIALGSDYIEQQIDKKEYDRIIGLLTLKEQLI